MEKEEEDGYDRGIGKEYCKIHDRSSNKHSYFLRAKAPRLMRFHIGGDHEDGRASSSSFLSSPVRRGSYRSEESSEEEDLANWLVMLSNNKSTTCGDHKGKEIAIEKGMFQCKACKKIFNSHQALGGHRASHKKVKGCFASKLDGINDDDEDEEINVGDHKEETSLMPSELDAAETSARKRVTKMHECSVCRRVFTSGQALGGHKRCHWLTTSTDNAFIPNFQYHDHHNHMQQLCKKPAMLVPKQVTHHEHDHDHVHDDRQLDLNLNLPPPPPPPSQLDLSHRDLDIINKTSKYEASTRLCLQQWVNHDKEKIIEKNGENGFGIKLRKLSDLRDVNMDGGWLQMGINTSTTSEMRL